MEKLTSRTNAKIKSAAALYSSARERKKQSRFMIEGARLCEDAALCGVEIETLFVTAQSIEKYGERIERIIEKAENAFEITNEIALYLSDTMAPQGIFCICKTIDKKQTLYKIDNSGKYIALENIQNPDNLGAVCRTAEALGISGLIVSGGCDIYNPKAQRAAMGALLRLPVIETDNLPSFLIKAREENFVTLASTPDSKAPDIRDVDFGGGVICVIGNEGSGITQETADSCDAKVTIPMRGRAQSLNAAGAAAIIMWELLR